MLLNHPDRLDNALVPEISKQWQEDHEAAVAKAKEWTLSYATLQKDIEQSFPQKQSNNAKSDVKHDAKLDTKQLNESEQQDEKSPN